LISLKIFLFGKPSSRSLLEPVFSIRRVGETDEGRPRRQKKSTRDARVFPLPSYPDLRI
jgi:hypothetical protein